MNPSQPYRARARALLLEYSTCTYLPTYTLIISREKRGINYLRGRLLMTNIPVR